MSKAICKKHNIENCPQCRFYPENGTGTDKQEENNCYSCSRFADCQTEPEYMFEHCDEWRPESNSDEIREAFENGVYNVIFAHDFRVYNYDEKVNVPLWDNKEIIKAVAEICVEIHKSALKSQQSLIDEALELFRYVRRDHDPGVHSRSIDNFLTKIEKEKT
jgi:hypothetical protein